MSTAHYFGMGFGGRGQGVLGFGLGALGLPKATVRAKSTCTCGKCRTTKPEKNGKKSKQPTENSRKCWGEGGKRKGNENLHNQMPYCCPSLLPTTTPFKVLSLRLPSPWAYSLPGKLCELTCRFKLEKLRVSTESL